MIRRQIFGLILVPIALTGVLCNWSVALMIRQLPVLKQSFGYLTASQAIGDGMHSTAFLFFICPMIIFDISILKQYSYLAGYILIFSYELSVISHFFISCNRFSAVYLPLKYNRIFSEKTTKRLIMFTWIWTIFLTLLLYIAWCRVIYWPEKLMFVFEQSPFCLTMSWYTDFWKFIIFISVIALIDIVTVTGVHSLNNRVHSQHDTTISKKNRQREINFLKQTCCQGLIFVFELVSYFICPLFVTDETMLFFLTTVAFVSVHAIDGMITIICNPEFKKLLKSKVSGEKLSSSLQNNNNINFNNNLNVNNQQTTDGATSGVYSSHYI